MTPRRASAPVVLDVRVVVGAGGGPETILLNSPRFLEPAGYRALRAYMHAPGDPGFARLRERARAAGAPLLSVPDRGPWDWAVVPRLLDLCRRERVAIWHGHEYKSNALGLFLRRFWPMRLVTTVHGWVHRTRRTPLYFWVDRLCLPRYDRVICVSEDLHRECLSRGVPAERCVLIENGVDLDAYRRRLDPGEAKRDLGVPPGRFLVGAVGRLSVEKGFGVLVRAIDRLLRAGVDAELVIAGEGPQRPDLEALIAALDRQGRVRLLGYLPDVLPLYQALDAFALSSTREGLPNVLLEAMALGVPVVATRVASVPRLVRHLDNGWLVEPGDEGALAGALARLAGDAALRAHLGQAGHQAVAAGYTFGARMAKVVDLYDRLLGRQARAAGRGAPVPGRAKRTR
jgi:glycosyltransferase involved in cell wall biosynthesis